MGLLRMELLPMEVLPMEALSTGAPPMGEPGSCLSLPASTRAQICAALLLATH